MLIQYHDSPCLICTDHIVDYDLLESDTKKIHTNKGSTGTISLYLPEGAPGGIYYTIIVTEQLQVNIDPRTNTIFDNNIGIADKYYSSSVIGSYLQICSDENGDWFVISKFGTWIKET